MIDDKTYQDWSNQAPWPSPLQVRQDLVISRALIEIYNHPVLKKEGSPTIL